MTQVSEKGYDFEITQINGKEYNFKKIIGSGGTSTVYLGYKDIANNNNNENDNNDVKYAIKVINLEKCSTSRIEKEIDILTKIRDVPNTSTLIDYELNNEEKQYYMVFKLIPGNELFDFVEEFENGVPEYIVKRIFKKICEALKRIHDLNIAHMDLKLENIMYYPETGEVTIIDFGFSTEEKKSINCCGTPDYISPEVANNGPRGLFKSEYDGKIADMWSLGVILYIMLCGDYPYNGNRVSSLFDNIIYGRYATPSDTLSQTAIDLIAGLLNHKTKERLTVDEVLEHPFLS